MKFALSFRESWSRFKMKKKMEKTTTDIFPKENFSGLPWKTLSTAFEEF